METCDVEPGNECLLNMSSLLSPVNKLVLNCLKVCTSLSEGKANSSSCLLLLENKTRQAGLMKSNEDLLQIFVSSQPNLNNQLNIDFLARKTWIY